MTVTVLSTKEHTEIVKQPVEKENKLASKEIGKLVVLLSPLSKSVMVETTIVTVEQMKQTT